MILIFSHYFEKIGKFWEKSEKNGKFQKKSENFRKNQKISEKFRKKDNFHREQLVDVFLIFQISTSTDP